MTLGGENRPRLIKVKERHHLMLLFRQFTGLQQCVAIVKSKTNQLLAAGNNFLIAEGTGFCEGQVIVFGLLHQVHHLVQLLAGLARLALKTLG